MISYKYISDTILIKIDNDGISRLSCSTENQEYLAWISEGNTPLSADPTPPPPKQFTSLEYLDLFTEDEQIAVVSATMTIPRIKLWYDKMLAAGYVTIADPRTEAGLTALVQAGLLQAERKSAILSQM